MPEATRDRLRQRFLDRHAELIPPGPKGQVTPGHQPRRPYVRSDERAIGYVPYRKQELPNPLPATLVAFYLPQFHTIPENDEWWGKGFTEWRNVTRALPQFEGHVQPRLPGDLGFYDLRDPEVMREQARLAREYGIGAFCFYFYWFGGKTLLETPLRNWLADPSIDFPFCLCWANEKWSRRWDGRGDDILIDQQHSAEDDLAFIAHVSDYLRDPRYLRVDGKPMLLIYRPGLLPDAKATTNRWRKWCRDNGVGEIHLTYVQGFERPNPKDIGFDAAVAFPPNLCAPSSVSPRQQLINPAYSGEILDWRDMVKTSSAMVGTAYRRYPAVNPGWDNEPRRSGNGRTYLHSSPLGYRDWLKETIDSYSDDIPLQQRLVFVNAWNEWAEGAVLEPDLRLGHAYLDATSQALRMVTSSTTEKPAPTPCVVIHAWHMDVFDEIIELLLNSGLSWRVIVTTATEHKNTIQEKLVAARMTYELLVVENRGRDILPFLHVANRLIQEGVSVVLKLHTKKSLHRSDGQAWRRELTNRLTCASRAEALFSAFERQPDLGLIAPEGHVLPLNFYWGANAENVAHLAMRMGIPEPRVESETFISGSMFWVRLEALRPLLDAQLGIFEFEAESGQVDGTLAHAVERTIGLCIGAAGFRIDTAASTCGEQSASTGSYAYASRN